MEEMKEPPMDIYLSFDGICYIGAFFFTRNGGDLYAITTASGNFPIAPTISSSVQCFDPVVFHIVSKPVVADFIALS